MSIVWVHHFGCICRDVYKARTKARKYPALNLCFCVRVHVCVCDRLWRVCIINAFALLHSTKTCHAPTIAPRRIVGSLAELYNFINSFRFGAHAVCIRNSRARTPATKSPKIFSHTHVRNIYIQLPVTRAFVWLIAPQHEVQIVRLARSNVYSMRAYWWSAPRV